MRYIFYIDTLQIIVNKKKIRNIHLKVDNEGKISVSCPIRTPEKVVEEFVISKIDWIKLSIQKLGCKVKYNNKKFLEGEKHYIFGKEFILKNKRNKGIGNKFYIEEDTNLIMNINPDVSIKTKEKHLNKWYEEKLLSESIKYFEKWEQILGVKKRNLIFKKMKGKWGYCDYKKEIICLNIELAKRNLIFIEYVILHELCHLIVPNHSIEFKKLLNLHMPNWKEISKNE